MNSINASTFKTHFEEVLNQASRGAVRITRRGLGNYILISEADYDALTQRARQLSDRQKTALSRLESSGGR